MTQRLLPELVPQDWGQGRQGYNRLRHLQSIDDLVNRPLANRVSTSGSSAAVTLNGQIQSTGLGAGRITPSRYAETEVKARVTFSIASAGSLYIYVMRTTGNIPAAGSNAGAGDVAVGGDAFAGPATAAGVNVMGTLSAYDTGLSQTQGYNYYLAVKGTSGVAANIVNTSQLLVSEF